MTRTRLKIAQVAPLVEAVPPRGYGGTERVVAALCDELVDQGQDVTLFAAAGSVTKAALVPMRDRPLRDDNAIGSGFIASQITLLSHVRAVATSFDVIHFHTELMHFPIFEEYHERCLTTLHTQPHAADTFACYRLWSRYGLVALSESHRSSMPGLNWCGVVHNGLPPERFQLGDGAGGYLAFLGRFSPDKGAHAAIAIAQSTGRVVKLAARIDGANLPYFNTTLKPHFNHPLVHFVGEIDDSQKSAFLGGASALLFPISWPEPFGLVMIEAMACGTPVIAFRRGSVEEIVEHGVSGFIVDNEQEAVAAVQSLDQLDRQKVRLSFDRRFRASKMARSYVQVYEQLLRRKT